MGPLAATLSLARASQLGDIFESANKTLCTMHMSSKHEPRLMSNPKVRQLSVIKDSLFIIKAKR